MTKILNPICAETYFNRGLSHAKNGEIELAIADYSKAIELKPDFAEAYYCRGGALLRLGKHEKAKSDLTTVRKMGLDVIIASDEIRQNYAAHGKPLATHEILDN